MMISCSENGDIFYKIFGWRILLKKVNWLDYDCIYIELPEAKLLKINIFPCNNSGPPNPSDDVLEWEVQLDLPSVLISKKKINWDKHHHTGDYLGYD